MRRLLVLALGGFLEPVGNGLHVLVEARPELFLGARIATDRRDARVGVAIGQGQRRASYSPSSRELLPQWSIAFIFSWISASRPGISARTR